MITIISSNKEGEQPLIFIFNEGNTSHNINVQMESGFFGLEGLKTTLKMIFLIALEQPTTSCCSIIRKNGSRFYQ